LIWGRNPTYIEYLESFASKCIFLIQGLRFSIHLSNYFYLWKTLAFLYFLYAIILCFLLFYLFHPRFQSPPHINGLSLKLSISSINDSSNNVLSTHRNLWQLFFHCLVLIHIWYTDHFQHILYSLYHVLLSIFLRSYCLIFCNVIYFQF
jgi:hypothetical protein